MANLNTGAGGSVMGDGAVERTPEEKLEELEAGAKGSEGGSDGEGGTEDGGGSGIVDDEASVEKVRQFMMKKGINDFGKLVDTMSDLESRNTKLDQDVRRLSAVQRFDAGGEGSVQGAGLGRGPAGISDDELEIELPENLIDLVTNKETLLKFAKGLVNLGETRQAKREQARDLTAAQIEVQKKMQENPEEFLELRPYMLDIARLDPSLKISQLYELAKQRRESNTNSILERVKKELGITGTATGPDAERIKALSSRLRTTKISSGTGTQVVRPELSDEQRESKELLEAIRTADRV